MPVLRYHTIVMGNPDVQGQMFMSGPQDESQISDDIKNLLNRKGVKSVLIMYNHGSGERGELIRKMDDK